MTALRTGPWRGSNRIYAVLGRRYLQRTRISLHESAGCGIVTEIDHDADLQIIANHRCNNTAFWLIEGLSLPCCELHISSWIKLVGVAGAIKHRMVDPHTGKHVPALFLPTRIEHYPSGGRAVFYQHTAEDPATSVIELTSEEAQATADEIESLGVHDGIDLAKDHWLRSRLRVLVAELDPQRDAIATYWLTAAAGSSYTVQMHVFCDRGVWRPRSGEHQTADFHAKMRDYSPHEVDHRAHRIELEDGTILKSRSVDIGANRP